MTIKDFSDEERAGIRFLAVTHRIDSGEYQHSLADEHRATRRNDGQFQLSDQRTDCSYTISADTRVALEPFKRSDGWRYARLFVEVALCYGLSYDALGCPYIRAWASENVQHA